MEFVYVATLSKHGKGYKSKSRNNGALKAVGCQQWQTSSNFCIQVCPKCNAMYLFGSCQYGWEWAMWSGQCSASIYHHPGLHTGEVTSVSTPKTEILITKGTTIILWDMDACYYIFLKHLTSFDLNWGGGGSKIVISTWEIEIIQNVNRSLPVKKGLINYDSLWLKFTNFQPNMNDLATASRPSH